MATKSLKAKESKIAIAKEQLKILNGTPFSNGNLPTFQTKLLAEKKFPVTINKLEVFQVNIGYMCNLVCEHCHVDAGPDRKEIMTKETLSECLEAIKNSNVKTVDLTGGAPEMNPNFRWFVEKVSEFFLTVHFNCPNSSLLTGTGIFQAQRNQVTFGVFLTIYQLSLVTTIFTKI